MQSTFESNARYEQLPPREYTINSPELIAPLYLLPRLDRPIDAAHQQGANRHKRERQTRRGVLEVHDAPRVRGEHVEVGLVHRLRVHGVVLPGDVVYLAGDCAIEGRVEAVVVGGREAEDRETRTVELESRGGVWCDVEEQGDRESTAFNPEVGVNLIKL